MYKNVICLHHNDADGICSAAIVKYFEEGWGNQVEMIRMNYGYEVPWHKFKGADLIYMVDYGVQPFKDMLKIQRLYGDKFIWIDHHETAIVDAQKSGQRFEGLRRIGDAGCELTWEYFSDDPMPEGVRWIGRYDVWDLEYHTNVIPFANAVRLKLEDPNSGGWVDIIEGDEDYLKELVDLGMVIEDYQTDMYRRYCKSYSFEVQFEGLTFLTANALSVNSRLFDSMYDPTKHDAVMTFGWINGQWTVSMYAWKDEVHVGNIAKKFGGGGHKGAAGYQCKTLPFSLK